MALETRKTKVGYGDRVVLEIDGLVLERGLIGVLGGPNGCGKSTLLKALARRIPVLSGEIILDGENTAGMSSRDFARKIAYVPQSGETTSKLSVEEYVALGRYSHQKWWSWQSTDSDKQMVEKALDRTELLELRSRSIASLSGGERQRASIAMALAQNAEYLLLDEPISHLDFKHQVTILKLLKALKNENIAILAVLHDLDMMSRLADRITLLQTTAGQPSRVAATGTPQEVLTNEKIKTVFEVEVEIFERNPGQLPGQRFFQLLEEIPESRENS